MGISISALCVVALAAGGCGGGTSAPPAAAPGAERTTKTAVLETGAAVIQAKAPVEKIAMYLNGFHLAKDNPRMQMEAHHYCNQVNEDFAQCVLFDGNTADARMMGLEYIISETLYASLPAAEKAYWHPHNYEILSGQLRLPGLPDVAERAALRTKINSYGKTWHTWMTGAVGGQSDPLPFGPPSLQWSFNRDGEANDAMVRARDSRLGLETAEARLERQEFVSIAKPQGGVDVLARQFPSAEELPGVTDNGDAATRPVPTFGLRRDATGQ